ncbi:MAG: hypothetical protein JXA38_04100 [Methanosarcinaceae archaeon]|nr:hypothetical protein [Methanosarcinaceae archaeon]
MAYYNEAKVEYLLADKLLANFGQTVNSVSLSILTNRTINNTRHFLNKMSPTYFIPYVDTNKTHGCLYKYRASTPKAERIRNELCKRLLTGSHLNLKHDPFETSYSNYSNMKILKGLDDYFIWTMFDLRSHIEKRGSELQEYLDQRHGDTDFFKYLLDDENARPFEFIIFNNNWYPPENTEYIIEGIEARLKGGYYPQKMQLKAAAKLKVLKMKHEQEN